MIKEGLSHRSEMVVERKDTALALGSGDLEVCATPAMLALMENASMLAVAEELPEGCTTVGGSIEASHLRPTGIGGKINATAVLTGIDGRKLYFSVEAHEGEMLIGKGTHLRFIVDRERFMKNIF